MHTKKALFLVAACFLFVGQGCVSLSDGDGQQTSGAGGMFVSTDRGESWSSISVLPDASGVKNIARTSVFALRLDPNDDKAMYWGSRTRGLFYSFNEGKSWSHATAPANAGFIYDVAVSPQDTCMIMATNGTELLRSTDCNRNFSVVHQEAEGDRIMSIAIDPFSPQRMLMALRGGDVMQSVDGGISWKVINRFTRAKLIDVTYDPNTPDVIYVSSLNKGLYRSDNAGQTWTSLLETMESFTGAVSYRGLYPFEGTEGVLYWLSDYGILRSSDRGNSWSEVPIIPSPGSVKIYAFGVNPANEKEMYYTATIDARSTFYRTVDGGENWVTKKLPSGQLPTELLVHPTKEGRIYLGFTIPPQ